MTKDLEVKSLLCTGEQPNISLGTMCLGVLIVAIDTRRSSFNGRWLLTLIIQSTLHVCKPQPMVIRYKFHGLCIVQLI